MNIGIMDGAYFVGRHELLQWINSTVGLNLTKIEQTASGAVACQLMDALHPGLINIAKVDFNAKNDYDSINNYKVLQAALTKLNIDKPIEVNKLVKARPLDNMEFMQWFKSYFDSQTGGRGISNYDGPGRRAASKTGDMKGSGAGSRTAIPARRPSALVAQLGSGTVTATVISASTPAAATMSKPKAPPVKRPSSSSLARHRSDASDVPALSQLQDLADQVTDLKLKTDNAERERDFYFSKLRDIEILCQAPELQSVPVVKVFERILYAADEAEARAAMLDATRGHDTNCAAD